MALGLGTIHELSFFRRNPTHPQCLAYSSGISPIISAWLASDFSIFSSEALVFPELLKDMFKKNRMTVVPGGNHLFSLFRQGDDPHPSISLAFCSRHQSTNFQPVDHNANGAGRY